MGVKQSKRLSYVRVPKPRQPTLRIHGHSLEIASNDFHEHQLAQLGKKDFFAGAFASARKRAEEPRSALMRKAIVSDAAAAANFATTVPDASGLRSQGRRERGPVCREADIWETSALFGSGRHPQADLRRKLVWLKVPN
jgi:hypothetical protein